MNLQYWLLIYGNYGSDMVGKFGGQFLLSHFYKFLFTKPGSACHWAIEVEFLPPIGDSLVLLQGKFFWQPTWFFGWLYFPNLVSSFVPFAAINSQQLGFSKELFNCFGVKTIEPKIVFLPLRLLTMSTATHINFSW